MMGHLVFALLLLAGAKVARTVFFDRWAPLFLFSAAWLVALAALALPLTDYRPVSMNGWLIVGGSYLAFAAGSLLVGCLMPSRRRAPDGRIEVSNRRLRWAVVISTLIGAGAALRGAAATLPQLMDDLAHQTMELREGYEAATVGSLLMFNLLAMPLGYLLIRVERRMLWKVVGALAVVAASVGLGLSLGRAPLLRAVVVTLVVHHYFVEGVSVRQIAIVIALVALIFIGLLMVRSSYYGLDHRFLVADGIIRLPQWLSVLSTPYMYASALIVAFDRLQASTMNFAWGAETGYSLRLLASKIDASVSVPSTSYEFFDVGPYAVNVATYLRHF